MEWNGTEKIGGCNRLYTCINHVSEFGAHGERGKLKGCKGNERKMSLREGSKVMYVFTGPNKRPAAVKQSGGRSSAFTPKPLGGLLS